jgi:quinoprotein relay system zinc metallohydrolase 1
VSAPAPLTRRGLLAGGAAAAALTGPVRLAAQPLSYELAPVEVADGLFMLEGRREYFSRDNGGDIVNVALLRTDAGVVVFDTGSTRRYGEALRHAAQGVDPRGVAAVIVSHHHPDHWFGDQAFADRPIHATPRTRALSEERGDAYADGLYAALGDWMRWTEPVPPASDVPAGAFEIGGRRLRPLPLSGHTDSDLALLDEATGVLLAGDLLFLDRPPTVPDADLAAWRASIALLRDLAPAAVLPGHGPFDPALRSMAQTEDYLDWLDARFAAASDAGLSMPETMDAPLPARFSGWPIMPAEYHRSVLQLYPAYEDAALPLVR